MANLFKYCSEKNNKKIGEPSNTWTICALPSMYMFKAVLMI